MDTFKRIIFKIGFLVVFGGIIFSIFLLGYWLFNYHEDLCIRILNLGFEDQPVIVKFHTDK